MKKTSLIILLIHLIFSLGASQEYYARHYSVYDGLPSPEVHQLAQDSLGRMIFVTRGGFVIAYDGFRWKKITPSLIKNKTHGLIHCIAVDNRGILWGADINAFNGLFYLKEQKWKFVRLPNSLHLANAQPLSLKIAYQNNEPVVLILLTNENLVLWKKQRFYFLANSQLPAKHIRDIFVSKNRFYIADLNGLYVLDDFQLKPVRLPIAFRHDRLLGFWISPQDSTRYYLLTSHYLIQRYGNRYQKVALDFEAGKLGTYIRYKIIPDGLGGIFIGSPFILRHFNAYLKRWEIIKLSRDFKQIGITDILKDNENNYWITSTRGIFKIPSLRFLNFNHDQGMMDEITSINEFSPNHFIFTSSASFTLYDGEHFKTIRIVPNANSFTRILTTMRDPSSGNILAAVQGLGIVVIKPDGRYSILPGPTEVNFNCILPDTHKKQSFWVGTSHGLWRLSHNRLFPADNPALRHKYIRRIIRGKNRTLYFATIHNGILLAKNGSMAKITQIRGALPSSNNIYAIKEVDANTFLVGTYDGLYELISDSLIPSSLFSRKIPIFTILQDRKKNIWLGSDQGVFVIHPNHQITHFDVRHGLSGMECNRDALYLDSHGGIWIGTNNGLSLYQPLYDVAAPAPLIRILDEPPHNDVLFPNQTMDDWSTRLLCISFRDERSIKLRYRLKGWEDWQLIPKLDFLKLSYWHLLPGTYQLQVQAQNVEGKWSPIVKSDTFTIPAPLWKRWYFLLLTILALIALIYFFIFTYYKTRINRQLEEEIRRRTQELKESEEKYRQLFMNSLDGIFITTPGGRFVDVNPAGVRFFGYTNKEALLKVNIPKDLYVNPQDRERFKNEMSAKGHVQNFEVDFKRKDGKIVTAVLSSTCVYDKQGQIAAYIGYLRDITEWKEMKLQLAHSQRMESLGLLAGGIAHDFNNILAGILGYASLMKMRMDGDDKLVRYVEIIEQSAQRAAELTNQLLIFSRRGQTKLTAVDLGAGIEEALKIIQSTFPKTIEVSVDIEKNLPQILADPTQMQQIIINLAVNARDALPDGEGKIVISAYRFSLKNAEVFNTPEAKPGEYVCLNISDTGIGIPEEIKQKIFEPFFSTKPKGKGTGMGLAMVYGAVRNLGGFIQLQSELNKGTTFSLYFPVGAIHENISGDLHSQMNLEGNEKILVVDDEETVRDFCRLALEKFGYNVVSAENGQQALQIFSEDDFDLIILDMIMPVMDGLKTYKKIRESNRSMRFLISSGYSESDKLNRLKTDPFVEVIFKPYKAKELVTSVRQILDGDKDEPNG